MSEMDERPSGRFVFRVSTSEASGPSGAGSQAEATARRPRADSGIRLTVPKPTKEVDQ